MSSFSLTTYIFKNTNESVIKKMLNIGFIRFNVKK